MKLQNCYGNGPISQCQDGVEVKDVKDEDVLCRTTAILEIFIEDTISNEICKFWLLIDWTSQKPTVTQKEEVICLTAKIFERRVGTDEALRQQATRPWKLATWDFLHTDKRLNWAGKTTATLKHFKWTATLGNSVFYQYKKMTIRVYLIGTSVQPVKSRTGNHLIRLQGFEGSINRWPLMRCIHTESRRSYNLKLHLRSVLSKEGKQLPKLPTATSWSIRICI